MVVQRPFVAHAESYSLTGRIRFKAQARIWGCATRAATTDAIRMTSSRFGHRGGNHGEALTVVRSGIHWAAPQENWVFLNGRRKSSTGWVNDRLF